MKVDEVDVEIRLRVAGFFFGIGVGNRLLKYYGRIEYSDRFVFVREFKK